MIDPQQIHLVDTWVCFLEMARPPETPFIERPECQTVPAPRPFAPADYRELYYSVGGPHHWLDRMLISDAELDKLINKPGINIFFFLYQGQRAGYVELVQGPDFVEILYFGLLPGFTGKGLGSYFLRWAISQAWSQGPARVQLNTCQLDHPQALGLYKKAGFQEVRRITEPRKTLVFPPSP